MAATASDFQDRRFLKHVLDNLHGIVYLEPVIYQPRFHRLLTSFCVFGTTCDEIASFNFLSASCYESVRSSKKSTISILKLFLRALKVVVQLIAVKHCNQPTACFSFLLFDLVHISEKCIFFPNRF